MKPMDEDSLRDLCHGVEATAAADLDAGLAAELHLTRSLLSRSPPPADPGPAVLVVRPGMPPCWLPLLKPVVSVGRHPGNDIVIDDPGISREHCRLQADGESWILEDLGSHNGTRFRDRRIHRLDLRSGDILRLGSVVVLFTDGQR